MGLFQLVDRPSGPFPPRSNVFGFDVSNQIHSTMHSLANCAFLVASLRYTDNAKHFNVLAQSCANITPPPFSGCCPVFVVMSTVVARLLFRLCTKSKAMAP
mmetsp:Transcript_1654/g.4507  ORF Transcript_1654/g.4507 Transcript_1654/m.4507 type:complete len:101 (-) Transcript_1654:326-628(-)